MSVHAFRLAGSGGAAIRGEVRLPDDVAAAPVVVGLHGFKGFRTWGFWPAIAASLMDAGHAFVGFDMSHNGRGEADEGTPDAARVRDFSEPALFQANTWAREEEDLSTVLATLRARRLPGSDRVDARRVALLGHSRGGGLAVVHAAGDAGVRATVALSPISTIRRLDDAAMKLARRAGFVDIPNARTGEIHRVGAAAIAEIDLRRDLHDIAENYAARLATPLLVVHGEADTGVAPAEGLALAAAAPRGKFVPVPGADHVLNCRHPWAGSTPALETFLRAVREFLGVALR